MVVEKHKINTQNLIFLSLKKQMTRQHDLNCVILYTPFIQYIIGICTVYLFIILSYITSQLCCPFLPLLPDSPPLPISRSTPHVSLQKRAGIPTKLSRSYRLGTCQPHLNSQQSNPVGGKGSQSRHCQESYKKTTLHNHNLYGKNLGQMPFRLHDCWFSLCGSSSAQVS